MNLLLQSNHNNIENPFSFKVRSTAIFTENFNSEVGVIANNGILNNVSLVGGNAVLEGDGYVQYDIELNGTYSIRIKFSDFTKENLVYLFDARYASGEGFLWIGGDGNIYASTGDLYVNGINTYLIDNSATEIVLSGVTLDCNKLCIGSNSSGLANITANFNEIEIYDRILTESEIANFYNEEYYSNLDISEDLLLDFGAFTGSIYDYSKMNTLVKTGINVVRDGDFYWAEYNGTTSKIDCGNDFIGTIACTAMVWLKVRSWGESGGIRSDILTNGKFALYVDNGTIRLTRNYSNIARCDLNALELDKWYFISVRCDISGLSDFYIGEVDKPPTQSGSANQNAGVPVGGTTNSTIGNNSAQTRTLDGFFSIKFCNNILSLQQITQEWSSTKFRVKDYWQYDSNAIAYIKNVYSDGGTVKDASVVNVLFSLYEQLGIKNSLLFELNGFGGILNDASNYISKMYEYYQNDATQTVGSYQPLFNSLNFSIDFDGVNDFVDIETAIPFNTGNTLVLYANFDDVSATQYFIGFEEDSLFGIRYDGSEFLLNAGGIVETIEISTNGFAVIQIERTSETNIGWYKNNAFVGNTNIPDQSLSIKCLGKRLGGYYANVKIKSISVFDKLLSSEEKTQISNKLSEL